MQNPNSSESIEEMILFGDMSDPIKIKEVVDSELLNVPKGYVLPKIGTIFRALNDNLAIAIKYNSKDSVGNKAVICRNSTLELTKAYPCSLYARSDIPPLVHLKIIDANESKLEDPSKYALNEFEIVISINNLLENFAVD